jgi:hypothetical protein
MKQNRQERKGKSMKLYKRAGAIELGVLIVALILANPGTMPAPTAVERSSSTADASVDEESTKAVKKAKSAEKGAVDPGYKPVGKGLGGPDTKAKGAEAFRKAGKGGSTKPADNKGEGSYGTGVYKKGGEKAQEPHPKNSANDAAMEGAAKQRALLDKTKKTRETKAQGRTGTRGFGGDSSGIVGSTSEKNADLKVKGAEAFKNANAKTKISKPQQEWFNVGAAGHALSKEEIIKHGEGAREAEWGPGKPGDNPPATSSATPGSNALKKGVGSDDIKKAKGRKPGEKPDEGILDPGTKRGRASQTELTDPND